MLAKYLPLSTDDEMAPGISEGTRPSKYSALYYHMSGKALFVIIVVANISLWLSSLKNSSQNYVPENYG